jgi:hypothetical protein
MRASASGTAKRTSEFNVHEPLCRLFSSWKKQLQRFDQLVGSFWCSNSFAGFTSVWHFLLHPQAEFLHIVDVFSTEIPEKIVEAVGSLPTTL